MMSGQTKMIIITSDEDLIRQAMFSQSQHTQIIDFQNGEQIIFTDKNNNPIINTNFLDQLSQINSKNDQVYKRALEASYDKQAKLSKKSLDLVCAVCGDRAIGYNYDVLSCASCKAFFLRNANQQSKRLRCMTGEGQCLVTHGLDRKCPQCRLDRCLAVGMKKDFLLSEEAKQRRKKPGKEKRSSTQLSTSTSESLRETLNEIDQLFVDLNGEDDHTLLDGNIDSHQLEDSSIGTLSIEDWISIRNIRWSFVSIFELENRNCSCTDLADRTTALVSWSYFINNIALNFITFFRQIDQFESLHDDDRFNLIKYNLHPIFPLFKCFTYKPTNDSCSHDQNNYIAVKYRQFLALCGDSSGIHDAYVHVIHSLVEVTGQDPTILSLLSIIFIFTQGLAMSDDQPWFKDAFAIHRAQNHYTELLWNYLVSQEGESQASRRFTRLLTTIFRIQSISRRFQEFFRVQMMRCNSVDRIAPIIQTVLRIS